MLVRAVAVVLMSAIANGVLLAYLAHIEHVRPVYEPRPREPDAAPRSEASPVAEPIEVAFLDETAAPTGEPVRRPRPPGAAPSARAAASARAAITAGTAGTAGSGVETAPRPGNEAPGGGHGLMKMRGPELHLDPATAERIAAAGGGAPRDEIHKSGKLESQPGGRAVIHDRVTTVSVEQDGTAHFDDEKYIDPQFHLPIPKIWEVDRMRRELGHALTEWYKDPEAGKRFGPTSELPRHLLAAPGACDSWGSTMCDDPLAPKIEQLVRERKKVLGGFLGGPIDITAWLHRKYVGDPYASRKRKLLDDTREERVAMGLAHRAEQRARSAEIMRGNLERLWARVTDPIARRAALFELWDECGEDEAGNRARAAVIGWIRARLPAGSAGAYTDAELRALDGHRTSRAAFAPYAE